MVANLSGGISGSLYMPAQAVSMTIEANRIIFFIMFLLLKIFVNCGPAVAVRD
jgi:hypothetical protein